MKQKLAVVLMLSDCITCDINITLLWWIGVLKTRYQVYGLEYSHPWFFSNVDNTSIWIETSLKRIFQEFWPQVLHSYSETPFDGYLWQYIGGKTTCPFSKNFNPSQKPIDGCLFTFWNTKYLKFFWAICCKLPVT